MQILYRNNSFNDKILSSKSEEDFLGEIACEAFKQENYFAIGYTLREVLYNKWWFYSKEMLIERLKMFK